MKRLRIMIISLLGFCVAGCAQAQRQNDDVNGPQYIALTFDDGPDDETTPQILDLLKRYNARATFFPMASKIAGSEAILARMAAERHAIGNHTLTHRRLSGLGVGELASELDGATSMLRHLTGQAPTVFRPPYAALDERVVAAVRERNMAIILWSMYPERLAFITNGVSIGNRIVNDAKDGDIVFMHDTSQRTVQAVETALRGLTEKGFTLVTVPELLNQTTPLQAGQIFERGPERQVGSEQR